MKRSGKFYRKNESEIMKRLGLQPTINSGSGWIQKEDGENEKILCQLKSTDSQSIKINKLDIEKLLHNSSVSHKLPVFAVQFLSDDSIYLLLRPEDLKEISEYLQTGKGTNFDLGVDIEEKKVYNKNRETKVIKSSEYSRRVFQDECSKKFKKERRSAT